MDTHWSRGNHETRKGADVHDRVGEVASAVAGNERKESSRCRRRHQEGDLERVFVATGARRSGKPVAAFTTQARGILRSTLRNLDGGSGLCETAGSGPI